MPPATRKFDEPITILPKARSTVYGRHHLMWSGADMRRYGLSDIRNLPCASSYKTDSMVHSLIHQRFAGFVALNHLSLVDLTKRSLAFIEQHQRRQCACWNRRRLCVVDALTLEACRPASFDGPPCGGLLVDGQMYEIMRDYYAAVAPATDAVRLSLAGRCDTGACGCMVDFGASLIRRPVIWSQLERRAA